MAANVKSKSTRKDVIAALTAVKERLSIIDQIPEEGLVCYAGRAYV